MWRLIKCIILAVPFVAQFECLHIASLVKGLDFVMAEERGWEGFFDHESLQIACDCSATPGRGS